MLLPKSMSQQSSSIPQHGQSSSGQCQRCRSPMACASSLPKVPCRTPRWFRVLVARMQDAASHTELMQGIYLAEGGQARRKLAPLTDGEQQSLRERETALKQQRLMEALMQGTGGELVKPEQMLDQLTSAAKQMPPDVAAVVPTSWPTSMCGQASGPWLRSLHASGPQYPTDRWPSKPIGGWCVITVVAKPLRPRNWASSECLPLPKSRTRSQNALRTREASLRNCADQSHGYVDLSGAAKKCRRPVWPSSHVWRPTDHSSSKIPPCSCASSRLVVN